MKVYVAVQTQHFLFEMSAQYEIFECAKKNDLKRVKELLDAGVDVNLKDYDTGSTPLIYACSNGSKQTMELLIERQINVSFFLTKQRSGNKCTKRKRNNSFAHSDYEAI